MTDIIKETENYTLSVGKPVGSQDDLKLYQIINKKYKVVEVETPMLPQAIKYMHDLEAGLGAVEDMYEEKKAEVLPIHTGRPRSVN